MWKTDLQKIFRIGTRGNKGGCNLSSCILVLIGIESFSLFFSKKSKKKAFEEFIDKYFNDFYKGRMGKIYDLFRHGLAHNFYPKSEFNLANTSQIAFGVDEHERVISLTRIKGNLNYFRTKCLCLDPRKGQPFIIYPQILFLDTIDVMNNLKKQTKADAKLQKEFVDNYKKVKSILRHKP